MASRVILTQRGLSIPILIVSMIGLLALMVVPLLAHQKEERLHGPIEQDIGPARVFIDKTMERAYEMQSYASEVYFHLPHADADYQNAVKQWREHVASPGPVQKVGEPALTYWRNGVNLISQWIDTYGDRKGEVGQDDIGPANTRFRQGLEQFRSAAVEMDNAEDRLQAQILGVSHQELWLTVPMVLIGILLALLIWRNFLSLQQAWAQEQESAARLKVAIKETNHRIKNNLQVVCSLLDVQLLESGETVSRRAVEETVQQVRAIAAVHDFLSHEMRESTVQGDLLLERLVKLAAGPAHLSVQLEASAVALEVKQATAVALIANELLLNAGKHGATEATVRMQSAGQDVCLQVSDNGPGFPSGFDPEVDANLGLTLVETLVHHDLAGDVAFTTNNGAEVAITFPINAAESTMPTSLVR